MIAYEALQEQGWATFSDDCEGRSLQDWPRRLADVLAVNIEKAETWLIEGNDSGYLPQTRHELTLHTDNVTYARPADLVALGCVLPADRGGDTYLADGIAVASTLDRELEAALRSPAWVWRRPPPKGGVTNGSAALTCNGRFRWWRYGLVTDSAQKATADRFQTLLQAAPYAARLTWSPGLVLVFDNRRMLHGRDAFEGQRVVQRAQLWLAREPSNVETASHTPVRA